MITSDASAPLRAPVARRSSRSSSPCMANSFDRQPVTARRLRGPLNRSTSVGPRARLPSSSTGEGAPARGTNHRSPVCPLGGTSRSSSTSPKASSGGGQVGSATMR